MDLSVSQGNEITRAMPDNVFDPPHGVKWTLAKGEMKENTGSWEIYPVKEGATSIAFYTLYADLKSMGGLVKKIMMIQPALEISTQLTTCSLIVKSTRERVETGPSPEEKKEGPKKKDSGKAEKF